MQTMINVDPNGHGNVVLMLKAVEKRFDRMELCIWPEAPDVFKVLTLVTQWQSSFDAF
jgi:hypothetical protein